jgi:hypothetical protein
MSAAGDNTQGTGSGSGTGPGGGAGTGTGSGGSGSGPKAAVDRGAWTAGEVVLALMAVIAIVIACGVGQHSVNHRGPVPSHSSPAASGTGPQRSAR